MESRHEPDLELKDLDRFYGSEHYYLLMGGVNATDGVHYIMANGYAWFATDAVAVLKAHPKLRSICRTTTSLPSSSSSFRKSRHVW